MGFDSRELRLIFFLICFYCFFHWRFMLEKLPKRRFWEGFGGPNGSKNAVLIDFGQILYSNALSHQFWMDVYTILKDFEPCFQRKQDGRLMSLGSSSKTAAMRFDCAGRSRIEVRAFHNYCKQVSKN